VEGDLLLKILRITADTFLKQRQTIISQFYQLDRLVVEGGKSVRLTLAVLVLTAFLIWNATKIVLRVSRRETQEALYGRKIKGRPLKYCQICYADPLTDSRWD
jgi:hypothetical protein